MNARPFTSRPRAFTLLEAVIALVIISSVIVSVLSLRSQSIAQGERLAERRFVERETESLFRMLLAGRLDRPTRDETDGKVTWRGEHAGRGYTIVRERTAMSNPMADGRRAVSPTISVWKYTITLGGRESAFYWHT